MPTDTKDNDPATGTDNDNPPMGDEVNRDLPVVCTVIHRVYPALSRFDNVDLLDDVELIGCAPWFDRSALKREDIVPW